MFQQTWSNNRSVELLEAKVVAENKSRSQVKIRLSANDIDTQTGQTKVTRYAGKVNLVFEDGRWKYDGGDLKPE